MIGLSLPMETGPEKEDLTQPRAREGSLPLVVLHSSTCGQDSSLPSACRTPLKETR